MGEKDAVYRMNSRSLSEALLAVCSFAASAPAQSGTLDQVSPAPPGLDLASFNGDTPSTTWQAQVRAGLTGQLEGFTLRLKGVQGSTLSTRLRFGPGWSTAALLFQTSIMKPTSGVDDVFVDVTSSAISIVEGQVFVIELQGENTGTLILGSHIDPASGPPLYAEPLFMNGPGCFNDCGWRIGFQTWVIPGARALCFGDGTGTPCPCGNSGAAGRGCANSIVGAGALLSWSGEPSVSSDTFTLLGSGMPDSTAIYLQGTAQDGGGLGTQLFDGVRCVTGSIVRLATKSNSASASQFPAGGDPTVSVRGSVPAAGGTFNYQVYYRNASATFCPPATANWSNGLSVSWRP